MWSVHEIEALNAMKLILKVGKCVDARLDAPGSGLQWFTIGTIYQTTIRRRRCGHR